MDAAQWPQGIGVVKPVLEASKPVNNEKKPRPPKEQALNCPRCNSTNTKFCYYNNYSLTQPRYFCKACRRYWTNGGSLRSVPVGGGSRKNKRSNTSLLSSSSSSPPSSKKPTPDLTTPPTFSSHFPQQNPKIIHGGAPQDLNLDYPPYNNNNNFSNLLALQQKPTNNSNNNNNIPSMEFLKNNNGISSSRGLNSFMPMPIPADCNTIYSSSGLDLHDFKPTLNFSLDGFENGYGNLDGGGGGGGGGDNQDQTNAKLFFPMEDLKTVTNGEFDHHQQQNRGQGDHQANGYWSGMLGGGSW